MATAEAPELDDVAHQPQLRKRIRVHKGEGLWLYSFSDMSLILMSFFVLQLSFSTPDKRKYDNLASAIAEDPARKDLASMETQLKAQIKTSQLDKTVEVKSSVNGLAIEFKDQVVFDPGSATANAKYAQVVDGVMGLIAATPGTYRLVIEGHTDDAPVPKGGKFKSNWELAAARGIFLLESFKARGVQENRVSVVAFGSTRPKVEVKDLTGDALKKARASNRRVVIRIE